MRDPDLRDVSVPISVAGPHREQGAAWGGLSGALVLHQGQALGIVVQHHPAKAGRRLDEMPAADLQAVAAMLSRRATQIHFWAMADALRASSASSQDFVLKGGVLLAAYQLRRPTADIDFANRVDSGVEHLLPLIQPACSHAPPQVLGPQALQIPTHPRENVLWVLDQLSQHRPVQLQRTFLITRQLLLIEMR